MAGRAIVGSRLYLQKEVTPGTPLVAAMKRIDSLRQVRPSWSGEAEPFKGGSGKAVTTAVFTDEQGSIAMEAAPCFNGLGYIAQSRMGVPTITTPVDATLARQSVFKINPDDVDTNGFYTAVWGDSAQAIKSPYAAFQSLGFDARRKSIAVSTSMVAKAFETGATIPSSGVIDVPSVPIQPNKADVHLDVSWAALGTTLMLAYYVMNLQFGDKFAPDAPINSSIDSYEQLLEAEDQPATVELTVGFDAAALALMDNYQKGEFIFLRYGVNGPVIEDDINYRAQWDLCLLILARKDVTTAPDSPVRVINFSCAVAKDPVSSNMAWLTLVNKQISY